MSLRSGTVPRWRRLPAGSPAAGAAARPKVRPRGPGAGRCGCPWVLSPNRPQIALLPAGAGDASRPGREESGAAQCRPPAVCAGVIFLLITNHMQKGLSLDTGVFVSRKLYYCSNTSCIWKSCSIYPSKIISVLFKHCRAITLAEGRFFLLFKHVYHLDTF